ARGRKAPPQHPPGHERRPDDIVHRYDALHKWRKQKAKTRGVESDVIVPRDVLWEIAAHPPDSAADFERMANFGPVRREKYGAEIIEVLKNLVNG
ncbi:MAG: HRDC domain-containing protein, partial [Chloroflexota bacterium]